MPRGAAVVRYQGKKGPVWRIKYRDAAGKQILETLGPEPPQPARRLRLVEGAGVVKEGGDDA